MYRGIPGPINEHIGKRGGQALLPLGGGDARGLEIFIDFDSWGDLLFNELAEVILLVHSAWLVTDSSPLRRVPYQIFHDRLEHFICFFHKHLLPVSLAHSGIAYID